MYIYIFCLPAIKNKTFAHLAKKYYLCTQFAQSNKHTMNTIQQQKAAKDFAALGWTFGDWAYGWYSGTTTTEVLSRYPIRF